MNDELFAQFIFQSMILHLTRLFLLVLSIIYINIFSCGQNTFGAYANLNSTSDSEFIHIIMWVTLSIDSFIFFSQIFEQDDGNTRTSLLIDSAFSLMYFVAFIILLVSWMKCPSNERTLFCQGRYPCAIHALPTVTSLMLTVLYIYSDVRDGLERFHSF